MGRIDLRARRAGIATRRRRMRGTRIADSRPRPQIGNVPHALRRWKMPCSDDELKQDVLERLRRDDHVAPREIGVTVKDGIVTLVGSVESHEKKWSAEALAVAVAGVRAVADELAVRPPCPARRDDAEIAREVALAFERAPALPGGVKAVVDDGLVTLVGEVDGPAQLDAAEERVRDHALVRGVVNRITVRTVA
jgi:osmotically-inducible protein OsmY